MVTARVLVITAVVSSLAHGAPPTLGQTACGRGANSVTGQVRFAAAVAAGTRLVVAIWWSGTVARVSSVTDTFGGTWRQVGPDLPVPSTDPFSVAIYESTVADGGVPLVTVTMDSVPVGPADSRLVDLTLLEFSGVAEIGDIVWAVGVGPTVQAGPINTQVPAELVFAYAGANYELSSSNGGLMTATTCHGDWSATLVADTPGSWGGSFTGPPGMDWTSVTFALRPTVADAGMDAGVDAGMDAGMDAGVDAGAVGPGLPDGPKRYSVGCACASSDGSVPFIALLLLLRRAWRLPTRLRAGVVALLFQVTPRHEE
ncbi:MAG: hypothetical protein AMXMBFR34_29360 [Myxococcaceae bacterium]